MNSVNIKIIDKKIEKGEQIYLIHQKGQHKLAAKWIEKKQLITTDKQYRVIVEKYDKELNRRYKSLKNIKNNSMSSRNKKKEKQISSKSSSSSERDRSVRRRKPKQHHQKHIFQKAKKQMNQIVNNKTLPASQFVLFINTPAKIQSNWVLGDKLKLVKEKLPQEGLYSVEWQDKTYSIVKQKQIIDRDPRKFCQFWQRKLGLRKWVQIKNNQM